jgi:hypothetical protein
MPALGVSPNKFKLAPNQNFKVFGDNLDNSSVTVLTTTAHGIAWKDWTTTGKSHEHLNVKATPYSTGKDIDRDVSGDLTVTVTDGVTGQTATQTYTPITYQP